MKITIIHGQSHKGSTFRIAHLLADILDGEVTEFFLPKDFGEFCCGCTNCFINGKEPNSIDTKYWKEQGWLDGKKTW